MSSSSSNTNDNLMKNEASMMFYCALAALSSFNLFHENEWKKRRFQSVNSHECVRDVLVF